MYAGVPLTTISKQWGTSITMIEQHYAGVIENWDGKQVPADEQIRVARALRTCQTDATNGATKPLRALSDRDPRKASGR